MELNRQYLQEWLQGYLQNNYGLYVEDTNDLIVNLGLDSIEAVSVTEAMSNHIGASLDPTLLFDCELVGDFLDAVLATQNGDTTGCRSNTYGNPRVNHSYAKYVNPYLTDKLDKIYFAKRFVRGEGCYLYDADDNKYLDFLAQYGALPFGYNPPMIWDALWQLREDQFPSFVQPSLSDMAGKLAELLLSVAPSNLSYVTFTNSGTECVEAAIKLARSSTGRRAILSTHNSFHGKTCGALSASGKASYQEAFALPEVDFDHIDYGDLVALEKTLAFQPERYAAFIVEPVQGEGGIVEPPANYLKQAQIVCSRHGVKFVLDEVQTGLGRTGSIFVSVEQNLQPDILLVAKALSGGLVPIGAVLCNQTSYSEDFALKHSSTYAGNALACAVGIKTLELLCSNDFMLLKQVSENGAYLKRGLQNIAKRFPDVFTEVRGRGYMLGIKLGLNRNTHHFNFLAIASDENELAKLFSSYLLNVEKLRVAPTLNHDSVVRIEPPLIATKAQCDFALAAISRAAHVFNSYNTGSVYKAILDGREHPCIAATNSYNTHNFNGKPTNLSLHTEESTQADVRFAFLIHPLDADSYLDYDASLSILTPLELAKFADSMDGLVDPFVSNDIDVVAGGRKASGQFIMVSHTAKSLNDMPRNDALLVLQDAITLARDNGAQLVGLGAYTSIVSNGGDLLHSAELPVTSGNAYTVVTGIEALSRVVSALNMEWKSMTAGVVGAAGSIGAATTLLLAESVSNLVLIGNPQRDAKHVRQKLSETVAVMCRELGQAHSEGAVFGQGSFAEFILQHDGFPNTNASNEEFIWFVDMLERNSNRLRFGSATNLLAECELVITATSSPDGLQNPEHLRAGAIVCDLSRPRTITAKIVEERPDVLVIDGGVVELPGRPSVGPFGLEIGQAYACMAETMLLALSGDFDKVTLGNHISLTALHDMKKLAEQFNFSVAALRSFGKSIPLEDLAPTNLTIAAQKNLMI